MIRLYICENCYGYRIAIATIYNKKKKRVFIFHRNGQHCQLPYWMNYILYLISKIHLLIHYTLYSTLLKKLLYALQGAKKKKKINKICVLSYKFP